MNTTVTGWWRYKVELLNGQGDVTRVIERWAFVHESDPPESEQAAIDLIIEMDELDPAEMEPFVMQVFFGELPPPDVVLQELDRTHRMAQMLDTVIGRLVTQLNQSKTLYHSKN